MTELEDRLRRLLAARAEQVESGLAGPAIRQRAERRSDRLRTLGLPVAAAVGVAAAVAVPFLLITHQDGPVRPAGPGRQPPAHSIEHSSRPVPSSPVTSSPVTSSPVPSSGQPSSTRPPSVSQPVPSAQGSQPVPSASTASPTPSRTG